MIFESYFCFLYITHSTSMRLELKLVIGSERDTHRDERVRQSTQMRHREFVVQMRFNLKSIQRCISSVRVPCVRVQLNCLYCWAHRDYRNAPPLKSSHVAIESSGPSTIFNVYTATLPLTYTIHSLFYLHSLIHRNILHRVCASCFIFQSFLVHYFSLF